MQVGTITDITFQNVTCTSEAGMVVAGSVDSTIEGLVLDNVGLELVQQTEFAGGFLDYRPGMRGIVDDVQTSAIFLEFANHVKLNTVEAGLRIPCDWMCNKYFCDFVPQCGRLQVYSILQRGMPLYDLVNMFVHHVPATRQCDHLQMPCIGKLYTSRASILTECRRAYRPDSCPATSFVWASVKVVTDYMIMA